MDLWLIYTQRSANDGLGPDIPNRGLVPVIVPSHKSMLTNRCESIS